MGDLFTGDRSSDAGPTIATRSRFPPVGRPTRLHRTREHLRTAWPWHNRCPGRWPTSCSPLLAAVLSVALAELAVACYIRCRPPNRIPNPMWRSATRRNIHGRVGSPRRPGGGGIGALPELL